ncbi:MAG: FG-GAP-like repeat-containing protein [Planctomycetota bacterium]
MRWWSVPIVGSVLGCAREEPTPIEPLRSLPLQARAAGDDPRFRRVPSGESGLVFANELRRENVIAYVYSGAGLAAGDYDGDGLPDLYLVNQDGPNRLFRQTAPLRFVDVTESAGGLGGGDAWGKAATFADVNGDGHLDIYVCNTESPNLLYLNQGDGTFVERAGPLGLAHTAACTGAAFADYDRDGDLDVFLLTNRVFGPNLPPELVAEVAIPGDVRRSRAAMFPPFPRFALEDGAPVVPDGYEDFFAVLHGRVFATGQRDVLLRNDGPAGFVDVSAHSGTGLRGNGLGCVWWDFDDDGWLDLYVANDIHSPDRLWRNRGDGTFEDVAEAALPHTAFFGMGCDFGDLDGDGRFDLMVADMSSTTHYMGKMLMGSMGNHAWFLTNARPPQYMRNALYRNTGTGRFEELAHFASLASTDWTWSVRFVDLDEDGRLDLHATNGIPVFEDNPDTIDEYKRLVADGAKHLALDLARRMERVEERNIARRNLGGFAFADVGAEWGLDELSVGQGAVFVDLDRDGDLDLVVNNLNAEVGLFENRTHDTHRALVSLRGRGKNTAGIGARVDVEAGGAVQSRLVSPTRGYMSAGEAVEHFGLGELAAIDRLRVRWPSGAVQEFTDLRADRHYVVTEPERDADAAVRPPAPVAATATPGTAVREVAAPAFVHHERPFDDYAAQPLLPHRLSQTGPGLAIGDVDGDGLDDLFVGGAAGQSGALYVQRQDGTFVERAGPWHEDVEHEDTGTVFVDHDGDGDLDLFVASGSVEAGERTERLRDRLYRNDGAAFTRAADGALPDLRRSSSVVAAADIDRDGDVDLFVGTRSRPGRYPESEGSLLLRNDGGRFVDATAALAPSLQQAGMVTAATFADVDADGYPDLVVAAQWQPLRALRNDGGAALVDATTSWFAAQPSGQWQSLCAQDLDGDGDLDLIAGNLGLNTKYKAGPARPLRLYAADFDDSGSFDVVEAKEAEDRLLPVRGLSCSSQAMPGLRVAFPTYDRFARATLREIYGQDALDSAQELRCDELQSLAFEFRSGRFHPMPLPRRAQIAPLQGIVAEDLDADGVLDLALAQNSFAPEPETGRFDGGLGLLLRGAGDLRYEALEPLASGFAFGGDQKALAAYAGPDGALRLLLATNDGPLRAVEPAGERLCVRLQGPAGNPTAIGASVELVHRGRVLQRRLVAAGNGYLTAGTACAFFAAVPDDAELRVRWPDGATASHAVPAGARSLARAR